MKRLLDLIVSVLGLAVSSPVLAAASIAVKRDSPGPVIFRQQRVGLGGRTFDIWKFRTMRQAVAGAALTVGDDPRVTRSGRFLRSTKLDELPQLVNVLRGEMSLVGPRPEVPHYVDLWPPEARDRILSVRPGITDPASIEFRRESEELALAPDPEAHYVDVVLPRKVSLYCDYVDNRSFVGDLMILVRTAFSVLGR